MDNINPRSNCNPTSTNRVGAASDAMLINVFLHTTGFFLSLSDDMTTATRHPLNKPELSFFRLPCGNKRLSSSSINFSVASALEPCNELSGGEVQTYIGKCYIHVKFKKLFYSAYCVNFLDQIVIYGISEILLIY